MPEKTADAATERIAEDFRHLSPEQLAERTLGGDRSIAKPLTTSDGQVFDLRPGQQDRIQKHRQQHKKWLRKASRRKKDPRTRKKPTAKWPTTSNTKSMSDTSMLRIPDPIPHPFQ